MSEEHRSLTAVGLLARSWQISGQRLEDRCAGLTDYELLWKPTRQCWNLVRDDACLGGWSYPYDFDPPRPHPVTTIGWRLVHLIADNEIYMEHAFGPGARNFPDLVVHGTAGEVLADWRASRDLVTAWLSTATDDDLLTDRPSHLGGTKTAGEVIRILLDASLTFPAAFETGHPAADNLAQHVYRTHLPHA